MKSIKSILIYTLDFNQNNPILKFSMEFVYDLLENFETDINVITLKSGKYEKKNNLNVYTLRQKSKNIPLEILKLYYLSLKLLLTKRPFVFAHMNILFLFLVLPLIKLFKLKCGAWYAHGSTSLYLFIVNLYADFVITSNKFGNRLPARNKIIVGQGVDYSRFKIKSNQKFNFSKPYNVISVGKISISKGVHNLLKSVTSKENMQLIGKVSIIGNVNEIEYFKYFKNLKLEYKRYIINGYIKFFGELTNDQVIKHLSNSDVFLSYSITGSLDKVLVEAVFANCIVFSTNKAWFEELKHAELNNERFFQLNKENPNLIDKFHTISKKPNWLLEDLEKLKNYFINHHDQKKQRTKIYQIIKHFLLN